MNTCYPVHFTNNNIIYSSVLQYYTKRKQEILDRNNYELSKNIIKCIDPHILLYYSNNMINKDVWDDKIKYIIMTNGNLLKFTQNKHLSDKLLETNNLYIVYLSDNNIWGIGENNKGKNLLGNSLMETRDKIKNNIKNNIKLKL
jgi:ribA/ribD-fused uncharacterized protein